jgi:hypothetical protein
MDSMATVGASRRTLMRAAGGVALTGLLVRGAVAQPPPAAAPAQAASWPHVVQAAGGGSATVYQPQVISWPGQAVLNARAAVSITRARAAGQSGGAAPAPVLGTIEVTARTTTDFATRLVTLSDLRLTGSRFPALDTGQAAQLEARLKQILPSVTTQRIPLDTLLLSLREGAQVPSDPAVDNDPPVIFHSTRPASLVVFDGDPVLAPLGAGSPLSVAVNTNWDVFFDPTAAAGDGPWYLLVGESWFEAPHATGPFAPLATLPEALRNMPDQPATADARRAIPGRPMAPDAAPTIFVSMKPAEIILTDGPPRFTTIPGTTVQMVSNSDSALFRHAGDERFYYLVSGRWFRAASLDGPWSFATPELPPDFAAIPPDSAAGNVLASIPGTAQAQEAVLQAQIPRTATLPRSGTPGPEVTYAGAPQFKPIPGTGLSYAVNTAFEVLLVSGRYYCCHEGAWYIAAAPTGPWALAEGPPPGVQRIPPSHPLHNVVYVSVYDVTPAAVTYGYTAGYLGGLVAAGVLVYGTGYWYPPVVLPGPVPVFFPYPVSYAGNVWYNPASGAWARGGTVYGPYGGVARSGAAYNPATGAWARGGAVYGPYGGAGAWSAYNPRTGTYARGSAAWGGGSGWANASFVNPSTGRSGTTTQSWTPYGRSGSTEVSGPNRSVDTASASNARGGAAGGFTSSTGAEGAAVRGAGGNQAAAVRTQGGNVYAGADGNVYRKTDSGWQKYDSGGWQTVTPPAGRQGGEAQPANLGATERGAAANPTAATQATPPRADATPDTRARAGTRGQDPAQTPAGQGGRQAGRTAGGTLDGSGFSQLEQDHTARQAGEMRQRSLGGGQAWGGFEPGQRAGGGEAGGRFGGGGGFHRR